MTALDGGVHTLCEGVEVAIADGVTSSTVVVPGCPAFGVSRGEAQRVRGACTVVDVPVVPVAPAEPTRSASEPIPLPVQGAIRDGATSLSAAEGAFMRDTIAKALPKAVEELSAARVKPPRKRKVVTPKLPGNTGKRYVKKGK